MSENEEAENKSTMMHGNLRLMWRNEAGKKKKSITDPEELESHA